MLEVRCLRRRRTASFHHVAVLMGVDEVLMSQVSFWIPSGPTGSPDSQVENKGGSSGTCSTFAGLRFTFSSATTCCSINQTQPRSEPGLVPVQDQDFKTCVNIKVFNKIMCEHDHT